jgi:HEAT repeat protein
MVQLRIDSAGWAEPFASMKSLLLILVTFPCVYLQAEDAREYRARKAFEAGSESEQKQIDAIRECAVSKIQTCVYPLIDQLKKEGKENATLRRESANALGRLRAQEARETLLQILPKESDLHVKAAIVRALGFIGNKADIKTVAGFLGDSEAVLRRSAARALFELNDKTASAEAAGKAAGEKDDYTRVEMLNTALQHEGGKVEHAIALAKILTSPDRAARLRAAEVLGYYGNKETLADLERAQAVEPDPQVRAALSRAIAATLLNN